MEEISNYINRELRLPKNRKQIQNVNYATSEVCAQIPRSTGRDVAKAVVGAQSIFGA